jgi:hypothetical protein
MTLLVNDHVSQLNKPESLLCFAKDDMPYDIE